MHSIPDLRATYCGDYGAMRLYATFCCMVFHVAKNAGNGLRLRIAFMDFFPKLTSRIFHFIIPDKERVKTGA